MPKINDDIRGAFRKLKKDNFNINNHRLRGEFRPELIENIVLDDLARVDNPTSQGMRKVSTIAVDNYGENLRSYLNQLDGELEALKSTPLAEMKGRVRDHTVIVNEQRLDIGENLAEQREILIMVKVNLIVHIGLQRMESK